MFLIDSHCHIDIDDFDNDRKNVIERALNMGIEKILVPNVDSTSIEKIVKICDEFPNVCFPMNGIHPTSVNQNYIKELMVFDEWMKKREFIGIGEIGIDLYWDKTYFEEQKKVFVYQLNVASELKLPVAIHSRNSLEEIIEIIKKESIKDIKGVFHCFPGNINQAKRVIDMGFNIGVGGVVTFKNSGMAKLVEELDLEHIILETDAPYLSPAPYRGKRNEPSYINIIAEKVAELKEITKIEVAKITTGNSLKLFNID